MRIDPRLRRPGLGGKRVLAGVALLSIVMGAAWWMRLREPLPLPQSPPGAGSQQEPVDAATMNAVLALEQRQRGWDETIWAKEMLAEQYEDRVVKLWDELRAARDPFAIFQSIPLESIALGEATAPVALEDGIRQITFRPPGRILEARGWQALLQRCKTDGYRLEQSEWHLLDFGFDRASNATSTLSVVLHVARPENNERLILEGKLGVVWKSGEGERPAVKSVDATRWEIYRARSA